MSTIKERISYAARRHSASVGISRLDTTPTLTAAWLSTKEPICSIQPPITATGVTDKDGHFVLGTTEAGNGAPAGEYQVAAVDAPRSDLPPPSRIDDRYDNFETSQLRFTVEPKRNVFDMQFEKAFESDVTDRALTAFREVGIITGGAHG